VVSLRDNTHGGAGRAEVVVKEFETALMASDGPMRTFVTCTDARPPRAVVIMLMDGNGIREALRDQARRLSSVGYYVMLPDLYYRAGEQEMDRLREDWDLSRAQAMAAPLTRESVARDVEVCLAYAAADPAGPAPGPIGIMGFCMGGRLAVTTAQALGPRVAAVSSLHPGSMATRSPQSPHLWLDKITAEIYFCIPAQDPYLSRGAIARLTEAMDAQGVNYDMEILPEGTTHGFSIPGNETYSKSGAERAWERTFELFERRLGGA